MPDGPRAATPAARAATATARRGHRDERCGSSWSRLLSCPYVSLLIDEPAAPDKRILGPMSDRLLVAIFFSFDFFQQLFFRLTLDAELRKWDGFQSPLTDLYTTLRADAIGALGEPC